MDCSLPGSSVHGNFQARMMEWLAIPFTRSFPISGIEPESPALPADSFLSKPPGKSPSKPGIYLIRYMQDLYVKNCKNLLTDTETDK